MSRRGKADELERGNNLTKKKKKDPEKAGEDGTGKLGERICLPKEKGHFFLFKQKGSRFVHLVARR